MLWLTMVFGAMVGLSLGLTGGGGALFAVPLLVYGLHVPASGAVATSLASVGAISLVGFLRYWKLRQVEIRTGLLFAAAGMLGAPVGTWLARLLPEPALMLLFAALMILVAARLWQEAACVSGEHATDRHPNTQKGAICQRDATEALVLNTRCALLLVVAGIATGILSGMFGIGGGLVIVPTLVLFTSMPIHRAVGTSLMVMAMVSVSGVSSQLWSGRAIAFDVMALFAAGGIAGVIAGQGLGRRISGPRLQKAFVVALLAVAAFVVIRNLSRPIHLDNLGPSHDKTPGVATEIASIFSSFGVPVVLSRRYNVGDLERPRPRTDGRGDFFP